ncbi:aminotransferase class IV [Fulvivirgaceae bacterium LMO-SS25]
MYPFAYFNGQILKYESISLEANDLSVLRGYGIFDFFRVQGGVPLFLDDYLNRFQQSAKRMMLPLAESNEDVKRIITKLIAKNGMMDSGFRLILTGGASDDAFSIGKPNFLILHEELHMVPKEIREKGGKLISYQYQRDEPLIKTINYSVPVRLKAQGKMNDALDVLYHDGEFIYETSRCNFFLVKNGELFTSADGVLEGVTRKQCITLASTKFKVNLCKITWADLREADEAFITSTTKAIQAITQVDDLQIGSGKIGEITLDLMRGFELKVKEFVGKQL